MKKPTVEEVLANPIVKNAFEAAWADSLPGDKLLSHEEGGWLFFDKTTGEVLVRRGPPGGRDWYPFIYPDAVETMDVLAMFHTHPKATTGGGVPEPTIDDREIARDWQTPGFVIADLAVYIIDIQGNVTLGAMT